MGVAATCNAKHSDSRVSRLRVLVAEGGREALALMLLRHADDAPIALAACSALLSLPLAFACVTSSSARRFDAADLLPSEFKLRRLRDRALAAATDAATTSAAVACPARRMAEAALLAPTAAKCVRRRRQSVEIQQQRFRCQLQLRLEKLLWMQPTSCSATCETGVTRALLRLATLRLRLATAVLWLLRKPRSPALHLQKQPAVT